ncbi:MAG: aminodeoxychorismate/anthranilate synthase component II [Bowdeniella nasicola]|nr:aminodeoxychorismate/anthranilate synthase component II [Bowdeniella nasicola]
MTAPTRPADLDQVGAGLRIRMVDNFDSFVHTIVAYVRDLGANVEVVRNDIAPRNVEDVDGIMISPGPGTPRDAGRSEAIIEACLAAGVPMLGVCLGHQALGEVCGARIAHAPELVHGKADDVDHDGRDLFEGIANPMRVARYHSLVIDRASVPSELEVSATSPDGTIQAVRHRTAPAFGVQFHPESILTAEGYRLLANWLTLCAARH